MEEPQTYQSPESDMINLPARGQHKETPLGLLVKRRMEELCLRQSDICRAVGFDQGLFSKIHSGQIQRISLESALILARGLQVSRREVLVKAGREDLLTLLEKSDNTEAALRGNE